MRVLKSLIKLEKTVPQVFKVFIKSVGAFGENISPFKTEIHDVKDEPTKKSVLCVGDERKYLMRCARKKCRKTWFSKFYEFAVLNLPNQCFA